jgi:hypothetical protein
MNSFESIGRDAIKNLPALLTGRAEGCGPAGNRARLFASVTAGKTGTANNKNGFHR